jgi:hypothetical protein
MSEHKLKNIECALHYSFILFLHKYEHGSFKTFQDASTYINMGAGGLVPAHAYPLYE